MEKAIAGNLGTKIASFRELRWSRAVYFLKYKACFKFVSWTVKIKSDLGSHSTNKRKYIKHYNSVPVPSFYLPSSSK